MSAKHRRHPVAGSLVRYDELLILRAHRRRGAGSALVLEAEVIAQEIGAWRLRLLVEPENAGARRFYETLAFEMSDRIFCQKRIKAGRLRDGRDSGQDADGPA